MTMNFAIYFLVGKCKPLNVKMTVLAKLPLRYADWTKSLSR